MCRLNNHKNMAPKLKEITDINLNKIELQKNI